MKITYIDVTNARFNSALDLRKYGISGTSIACSQARELITSGQYEKVGNYIIRGDSDIRLHEGNMLMAISRNGGTFQVIARKKPTGSMPA